MGVLEKAKKQVQRLPLPLFFPIYSLWSSLTQDIWAVRLRRQLGIPLLSKLDLASARHSDIVFILGSGPSINKITAARWEGIKANDSIGLNNWLVHPWVPTFYCFESAQRSSRSESGLEAGYDFLLGNIRRRAPDYRRTIKIIGNLKRCEGTQIAEELPQEWKENLYFVETPPVVARNDAEFSSMIDYYKKRQLFDHSGQIESLFKYSSVITTCISLAVRLGYSRIVLCGVDLRSYDYFYHAPDYFPETAHVSVNPRGEKHDTIVAKPWLVPIDRVLMIMLDKVLGPAGIELYVENSSSLLHPRVPLAPDHIFAPARRSEQRDSLGGTRIGAQGASLNP